MSRVGRREGANFISPSVQREQIHGWAKLHRHAVIGIEEDLDRPGSTLDRPGLKSAIAQVKSGGAEGMVVARLDRAGRSVVQLAQLLEILHDADGRLVCVAEGIDSRGATGKLVADIMAAIGEWELERIRQSWKTARGAAVERGVFVGGHVPFGYKRGEGGKLVPDAELASAVKELFEMRRDQQPWTALSKRLEEHTGRAWSIATVRSMVGNRTYLGEVHGGQGMVNSSAHTPLVGRALFEAANATRAVVPPRSGTASGLLSGILRCAGCRYAMKPAQNKSRHGKAFLEYRCKAGRRENSGPCKAPASVSAGLIEPFISGLFLEQIEDSRLVEREDGHLVADAADRLESAEAELAAVLDQRIASAVGEHSKALLAAVESRVAEVDIAKEELLRLQQEGVSDGIAEIDPITVWPNLVLQEKRHLLSAAFPAVFVRRGSELKDRVFVFSAGEALPDLPSRGRRWTPIPFEFPR